MSDNHTLKSGDTLRHDTYRIEKSIGQGGFGITYLAIDTFLDKKVAIKEFFPKDYCNRDTDTGYVSVGTSSKGEFVSNLKKKFIKEARNIAKQDHKGIVKIHAAFEENNTAYYVMDFIEGDNLSEKVRREGPLPPKEALRYIMMVGEALEYIHSKDMNHLDVKPANIMVRGSDDCALLIDFGLSKQYNDNGEQTSFSPSGVSKGFAAKEQYGENGLSSFSPETDVYSLGATLYYLLTGIVPPDPFSIGRHGLEFPPEIPHGLVTPIKKAMALYKEDRYKSVSDFLHDLRSASESEAKVNGRVNRNTESRKPERGKSADGKPSISNGLLRNGWFYVGLAVAVGIVCLIAFLSKGRAGEKVAGDTIATDTVQTVPINAKITYDVPDLGECEYEGELLDGVPNGKGKAEWKTGIAKSYDGEWRNGNLDGKGTFTYANGDVFTGTLADGEFKQGKVSLKSTGETFEGSFKDGQPDSDNGKWY